MFFPFGGGFMGPTSLSLSGTLTVTGAATVGSLTTAGQVKSTLADTEAFYATAGGFRADNGGTAIRAQSSTGGVLGFRQTFGMTATTIANTASVINRGSYAQISNTTGGSITLGATVPVIANGSLTGEIMLISNVGTQDVVLPDEAVTAGSNLRLTGAGNLTMTPGSSAWFIYDGADWRQVSPLLDT